MRVAMPLRALRMVAQAARTPAGAPTGLTLPAQVP